MPGRAATRGAGESNESKEMHGAHMAGVMDESTIVFDVRIETPSRDAHEYVTEVDSREVRLRRTVRAPRAYPADWAILPGSLTPAGEPLGVLVLTDVPCSPGAVARVRLIGMATVGQAHYLVAVLVDDAASADVTTWRQLRADTRYAIASLLSPPRATAHPAVEWAGPGDAARVVRDARLAARLARAEFHATRGRQAAWKVGDTGAPEDERIHTRGEARLARLPYRFQEYVARLLVPEERILAFVPRPAEKHRRVLPFGRRAHREEGLLVITDQQVVWLEDVLAAPIDITGYGYVARSVPLERLTAARLAEHHATLELVIEARTPPGDPCSLGLAFPRASVGLLRAAVETIERFLGAPTGTALMRIAHPPADETALVDLVDSSDEVTSRAVEEWARLLRGILDPSERIIAKAVIPGWAAPDHVPRLWLVSDMRIAEVRGDATATAGCRTWHAADVCGVRLTWSVFESSLQFEWANRLGVVRERFAFPLETSAAFTRLFVAARRTMVGRCGFRAGSAREAVRRGAVGA